MKKGLLFILFIFYSGYVYGKCDQYNYQTVSKETGTHNCKFNGVRWNNKDLREGLRPSQHLYLSGTDWSFASLQGVNFDKIYHGQSEFISTNLSNAKNLKSFQSKWHNATLRDATFKPGETISGIFKNVKANGVQMEELEFLPPTDFEGGDFRNASFINSDLREVQNLDKAKVTNADFTRALVTPNQAKFLKTKDITGFIEKGKTSDEECAYKGDLVFVETERCGQFCYGQAQCPVKGFDAKLSVFCKTTGGKCPSVNECIKQSKDKTGVKKIAKKKVEKKKRGWLASLLCFFCSEDVRVIGTGDTGSGATR